MHQSTSHPESRRLVIIGVLGLLMLHCAAAKTLSAGQQCEGPNMVTRVCGDGLACVPESPGSRVSVCRGNVRVASRVRCCIFHCDFACANCIYMHDHSNQPLMLAPTIKWRSTYLTPICYLSLIASYYFAFSSLLCQTQTPTARHVRWLAAPECGVIPACSTCQREIAVPPARLCPASQYRQSPVMDAQRTMVCTTARGRPGRETRVSPAPARPDCHSVPPCPVCFQTAKTRYTCQASAAPHAHRCPSTPSPSSSRPRLSARITESCTRTAPAGNVTRAPPASVRRER